MLLLGHARTVAVLLENSDYTADSAEYAFGIENASMGGHLDMLRKFLAQPPIEPR